MNGPVEEVGRTARSLIDVLKDQPLSLALVVMNAVLLLYLFYTGNQINQNRNAYLRETQQILASCIHVDDLQKLIPNR